MSLKAENLTIGYTSKKDVKTVLSNISFHLKQGEFIGLFGRNGTGKSTLLKTLSRQQNTLGGTVFINEKNLAELSFQDLAKQIAIVDTHRLETDYMTVFDMVALGRTPYTHWSGSLNATDKTIISNCLNAIDIAHLQNKGIDELSDGEYQKTLIARALAQETDIILMDEPSAFLDVVNKAVLFELLAKLAKEQNKLILISSHEINLLHSYLHKIVLITKTGLSVEEKSAITSEGIIDKLKG